MTPMIAVAYMRARNQMIADPPETPEFKALVELAREELAKGADFIPIVRDLYQLVRDDHNGGSLALVDAAVQVARRQLAIADPQ